MVSSIFVTAHEGLWLWAVRRGPHHETSGDGTPSWAVRLRGPLYKPSGKEDYMVLCDLKNKSKRIVKQWHVHSDQHSFGRVGILAKRIPASDSLKKILIFFGPEKGQTITGTITVSPYC